MDCFVALLLAMTAILVRPAGKSHISAMRKLPVVLICRRQHTLRHTPDTPHIDVVPRPQEGRFAIVTDVGRGMRWTQWRRKTSGANADGEVVWS